jgi:hypothetical protein
VYNSQPDWGKKPQSGCEQKVQRQATPWERRLYSDSVHTKITSTFQTNQNTLFNDM